MRPSALFHSQTAVPVLDEALEVTATPNKASGFDTSEQGSLPATGFSAGAAAACIASALAGSAGLSAADFPHEANTVAAMKMTDFRIFELPLLDKLPRSVAHPSAAAGVSFWRPGGAFWSMRGQRPHQLRGAPVFEQGRGLP